MTKAIDITGQKFAYLTAVRPEGRTVRGEILWLCRCECGGECVVRPVRMRTGETKSCGCHNTRLRKERMTTHGLSKVPEYNSWVGMKRRCYDPGDKRYELYGGRGIQVCQAWIHCFDKFFYDMGSRPSSSHSLDRIDTDGDYCRENCRWATPKQQQRNRRNNVRIKFSGHEKCISEWAESTGIQESTIRYRLKNGWSIGRALTTSAR